MNFQDNKVEISIMVLAFVLVGGVFKAFSGAGSRKDLEPEEISYEMPRPKSDMMGEFSLNDREIERREIALKAKEEAKAADAKKTEEAKKAALAAKQAQGQKQSDQARAGKVSVKVIPRADNRMSADANAVPAAPSPNANPAVVVRQTAGTDGSGDDADKKANKTAQEWQALLDSSPTKANMALLVKAVQAGDLDDAAFYSIIDEMIKSKDVTKTSVAFYGLGLDTSAQSFEFVVKEEGGFPTDAQATAGKYLTSFATSNRTALVQEVQNSDEEVALKAGQIILAGIQGSGTTTSGDIHTQSLTVWSKYAPVFQHLATTSSDASMKTLAAGILALLGVPVQTATA